MIGALQLVKRRLVRSPKSKSFNCLAIESVLYQIFRISAFASFAADVSVGHDFYMQARLALQDLAYPDESAEANTPVIGMPVQLQEFIVRLTAFTRGTCQDQDGASLMEEMARWEEKIGVRDTRQIDLYQSNFQLATAVYVLAASLIIDHFIQEGSCLLDDKSTIPQQTDSRWQVREGVAILKSSPFSGYWTRCFLGCWPALALGLAASTEDEVAAIRNDIQQRWSKLMYSEALFVMERLEAVWTVRKSNQGRILTELEEE